MWRSVGDSVVTHFVIAHLAVDRDDIRCISWSGSQPLNFLTCLFQLQNNPEIDT